MRTPRTAYVHIGVPKTGSTAIQSTFHAARDQLEAQGYHYLEGPDNHSEVLAMAFWDEADAINLGKYRWYDVPEAFLRYRAELRDGFSEEIERAAPQNVIISAEELCGFRDNEKRELLAFLEPHFDRIKVIAFAREPQSWLTSSIQQGTKWSGDILDDTFAAPRPTRYERWFRSFLGAVGAENFDLIPYVSRTDGFDVIAEFSRAIGLEQPLTSDDALARENASISHRTAIILSAINGTTPPFADYRHNPFRAFSLVRDARFPGRRFSLPMETVQTALDDLERERDWLNTFFGTTVFERPAAPKIALSDWYEDEREDLETFARMFAAQCSKAQNEQALKAFLKVRKNRSDDAELADKLLGNAWMLATDRWTLHQIATEAVDVGHPDRQRMFVKQRIMRRIEEPEGGDPPMVFRNPFQRDDLD